MESSGRTLVCSVLFLDIVEYSKKPVSEQLQLKHEFNRVLTKSREPVPGRDRIILDTGDGAAVTFMGDPEDALFASMAMLDAGVLFLAILAGGVGARALLEPGAQPQSKPAAAVGPSAAAAALIESPAKAEAPLGKKLARLEKQPAPLGSGNARVELAVAPWGEVLVDGHSRGVSPPLRVLEVAPGAHTVEIRNSTFPAHVEQVQLKAGEAVRNRPPFWGRCA